ncbi:hypothetical protein DFAR_510009 [Desulfarculales bacterium]
MLLTNHHKLTAFIVAGIYKDRWEIELFLKALKQNLKVKTFVVTGSNNLKIQVLSNLAAMLRLNLFTYRELRAWFQHPYHTPSLMPEQVQLPLLP